MKALAIGEIAQGVLLGVYSTEQRSKAMDILLALRNYYETGVEPVTDGSLIHADTWAILKKEADSIIQADDKYHEKQRNAARARWAKRDAPQCDASKNNAPQCDAKNRNAKENKKEINNPEKEINKEKAPLLTEGSVGDINISSSESVSGSVFYASDPAMYAMNLVGRNNKRDYQTFSGFLRKLGRHEFCDIVNEFDSQKRQGEMNSVKNLAAVLVTKLKSAK